MTFLETLDDLRTRLADSLWLGFEAASAFFVGVWQMMIDHNLQWTVFAAVAILLLIAVEFAFHRRAPADPRGRTYFFGWVALLSTLGTIGGSLLVLYPDEARALTAHGVRLFEASQAAAMSLALGLGAYVQPFSDMVASRLPVSGLDQVVLWSIVGVSLLALVVILGRRQGKDPTSLTLADYVRGPRRLGWATILLVFGVGGGLAAAVPLSGAAIAPGIVSPDGSRKTVQHLEGGIVRQIHVREGDPVTVGQPLLTLQDTQAQAEYGELSERLIHFVATEARLMAEQSGATSILPTDATALLDPNKMAAALRGQSILFESRIATLDGREKILGQRIMQLEEESNGVREVMIAQDEQLALIDREIAGVKTLLDQGLERLPRLLALERAQSELRGERAANVARIARNEQAIGESEMELLTLRQEFHEKGSEELNGVRAELATLRSKLPARLDILDRTIVTAPIAGTVMNIQVTTETGVVRPGDPLLEIVPQDAVLIVDARVRPIDIDVVRPGMGAQVMLSAFTQRNLPQIHGTLRSISADHLTDERTGESYFLAKVEVDGAHLKEIDENFELTAGMPADVFILTGERTALDYLIKPFIESITKSFRES